MGGEFWLNRKGFFDGNVCKKEREYCEIIGKDKKVNKGIFYYNNDYDNDDINYDYGENDDDMIM